MLWKDNAFFKRLGKRLDAHVADKLLRDGRVRLKDCKSAKGKTYNATVLLGTEPDGRSKFSLELRMGLLMKDDAVIKDNEAVYLSMSRRTCICERISKVSGTRSLRRTARSRWRKGRFHGKF